MGWNFLCAQDGLCMPQLKISTKVPQKLIKHKISLLETIKVYIQFHSTQFRFFIVPRTQWQMVFSGTSTRDQQEGQNMHTHTHGQDNPLHI